MTAWWTVDGGGVVYYIVQGLGFHDWAGRDAKGCVAISAKPILVVSLRFNMAC